jgi:hypothetical protein
VNQVMVCCLLLQLSCLLPPPLATVGAGLLLQKVWYLQQHLQDQGCRYLLMMSCHLALRPFC